ncbi:protein-disulfide reductase DsbD [Campylobacter porcelli]|uniref:protein-disulfide reductase DsbD n=1 Tax=Campylobacter porcelli TaxID=1660073 RepID=UPI000A34B815|nr:protein-disulfide reductase DsbD [Campylobacter sp. P0078]
MKKLLYLSIFIVSLCLGNILEPKDAFKIAILGDNQSGIVAKFDIANGVYLYQDKIKIELDSSDITKFLNIPKAIKYDNYEIYRDLEIFIPAGLAINKDRFELDIYYQGCSDSGFCYQPLRDKFDIKFDTDGKVIANRLKADQTPKSLNKDSGKTTQNEQSQIALNLENNSILWIISTFFIYGVLLSFTPCVFPMIPILSGLIISKGSKDIKSNFIISLIYVLSMSFTYAIAGVVASMIGASVQGLLQTPVVLIIFSALFVILSLCMFGLFEFDIPKSLQSYINSKSSKFSHIGGVIFMGVTSALIVGPCVAAPLAGALLYIANSGDMVVGGVALFVMSFGMGLPLLAIGLGANKFLPKPGEWMIRVKIAFGFIMLAMAIWVVSPILKDEFAMLGYAILGVIFSVIFGTFDRAFSMAQRVIKAISIIIFSISIVVIVDFSIGKFAPNLKPNPKINLAKNEIKFDYVTNLKELKEIIKTTKTPLLIDFWASWCVNCKELESSVFTQSDVAKRLSEFKLIKIDVSQNSIENQELMKEYQIFGPPVLLIYNNSQLKYQITGLITPEELLEKLNQI